LGWDIEVCNHVKVHLYGASIHLIWASIHASHFLLGSKHGANSIVSIHQNPKPSLLTFLQHGLGVEK